MTHCIFLIENFQIPETRIDVEVPKITTNLGKELHFVKLPNFLSIDCRPFDAETYEDEIEDEDSLDEEGRARLKLKVENTIRWRQSFDAEGKSLRESNAKFIRLVRYYNSCFLYVRDVAQTYPSYYIVLCKYLLLSIRTQT